jgi:hypothetical protein
VLAIYAGGANRGCGSEIVWNAAASGMRLVFINNSTETFTPTQSGALATIIWECCRTAEAQGTEPLVITRRCDATPFPWCRLTLVEYPKVPTSKLGVSFWRAERKLTGWRHLRQREYARRVARAVGEAGLQDGNLVLINDPEMAVALRDAFPRARIIHWFQNQHECKPRARGRFAGAVTRVAAVSGFTA